MTNYFTTDYFKLLKKWKGQKRDDSNPEQNRAYKQLVDAYKVTDAWAKEVQAKIFPAGLVEIRKRPTNQGNNFAAYNWAKIYPYSGAPKQLAYTVGIDADDGFVVKIDTVGLEDNDPVRRAYFKLRGACEEGVIVAKLPADKGLRLDFTALVEWSVEAIEKFKFSYDDVANQLELSTIQNERDLLQHFQGHKDFVTRQPNWSPEVTELFCRLAGSVHDAGLDWWFTNSTSSQLRFGRKEKGREKGRPVGWLFLMQDGVLRVAWDEIGSLTRQSWIEINDKVVRDFEALDHSERDSWPAKLFSSAKRKGYWPDEFGTEDFDVEYEPNRSDKAPRNIIYYGPPGTGKTYEVSKLLRQDYEQAMSSVSEQEWRKQFIAERIAPLKWWEGAVLALLDLGGKANVTQLLNHPFINAIVMSKGRKDNLRQTLWTTLQERTIDESSTVKQKLRFSPQVFDKDIESVWQLVGEWKEACADLITLVNEYRAGARSSEILRHYSFVTFHQSYGYEEFVEGLRPVLDDDTESGTIKYQIKPGAFKELCRKARLAPNQQFAMVIDEINRGNISKIFGELITLIEPDKREGAENAVSVTLPYSGESFSVPPNVDIIGTMNTADRSLALLDTALRRRFDFVSVLPDARDDAGAPLFGLRVTSGKQVIDIPRMLSVINQRIEALYDRDHCIGHAYFTSLAKVPDGEERLIALSQIFSNRIIPLLEEYFFEDWQKIRLVLADNQKAEESQFVVESQDQEEDLARLFGRNHGLGSYDTKQRYVVQDTSITNPDAYIGIYQTLLN